ncbi:MAG TPA: hypothetical protein IAA44_05970 [Candidatus Blautia avistercoris]|uniref:hypothetical protein n=1 Tax=Blautia sp. An249 TaxID=1965603 RepID=UPI000B3A170B|nr:hypothetical protein [Blautia sp. An249]OUO79866.1 hypothetical protein B5F53_05255 [Blautia sp. An249]HIY18931.1 hypothetical protein [Candidatus Blautia avistercoris]
MTGLLELKQKIKNFYGQYEVYLLPCLKFALALIYFLWINTTLGFMEKLNSPFVILVLALICSILPSNAIVYLGFLLIAGHCYGVGIEVAGFALVLILFLMILFLRFSAKNNLILAFTPLGFAAGIPTVIPMGGGLLSSPLACIPAGCGAVFYFFVEYVSEQAKVLQNADTEMTEKIKMLADGLMKNQEMWITVVAFVAVTLLVNLIRTRAIDYAWRIAIVAGGVLYIFLMLAGSLFLNTDTSLLGVIISSVAAIAVGIVLEFFVYGGDYTRTERLEYEDDEYYYYVKAVPKLTVATSERNIKKINAEPITEEPAPRQPADYVAPMYADDRIIPQEKEEDNPSPAEGPVVHEIDFEKKLEESLKDL